MKKFIAKTGDLKLIDEHGEFIHMLLWMLEKWIGWKEDPFECIVLLDVVRIVDRDLPKTYAEFEQWLRDLKITYVLELGTGYWTAVGPDELDRCYTAVREFITQANDNNSRIEITEEV